MNVKCKLSDREDNASSQREPVPSSHLDLFQLRFLSQMQDVAQLAVSLGRGIAEDWPEVALIKIRLNLSSICESSNIISTCT